jgi:hypothetical protein
MYLRQVHDAYDRIREYHKQRCETLQPVNPEQAEAQLQLCLYWFEKTERLDLRISEMSGQIARFLKTKYRQDRPAGRIEREV